LAFTLSLAMIVKDEEQVIGRVLDCARNFCDELVVVDTGSTDRTVEIAQSFGAKVFYFDWIDDFAAARNFSFAQCTGEWVIWLDADDVVPEDAQVKIRDLKAENIDPGVDTVACSYQIAFAADGKCITSVPRERIIRRSSQGRWESPIHESFVQPQQSYYINRLDICIEHRKPDVYVERSSDRNLKMLDRLLQKGDRSARMLYFYGRELRVHQRPEEALQAFREHVETNPENDAYRYQALQTMQQICMELNREDEALSWGMQAIQSNSGRAEAYVELGVLHYRRRQFAQAIPLLMAATVCQKPTSGLVAEADYSWRPWHYLSLCYEGLGDFSKAIEAALKAYPDIPDKAVIRDNIRLFAEKMK
jgi:glycosyltransferase involved in cell wall biosynthesis